MGVEMMGETVACLQKFNKGRGSRLVLKPCSSTLIKSCLLEQHRRRAKEGDELPVQCFLRLVVTKFSRQNGICAELQQAVHIWKISVHNFQREIRDQQA